MKGQLKLTDGEIMHHRKNKIAKRTRNIQEYLPFSVIIRVKVVFRKTVVGDLSGSHLHVKSSKESSLGDGIYATNLGSDWSVLP